MTVRSVLFPVFACVLSAVGAAPLRLVDEGRPVATIVTASEVPYSVELAVRELNEFIGKMTGAQLPVATEADEVSGPRVLVGESRLTKALGIEIPHGYALNEIKEGYFVRRIGTDLVLAGNDGNGETLGKRLDPKAAKERAKHPYRLPRELYYRGSLFAVYDFLFEQGCRWYMPGEFGEVVPKRKTLEVGEADRFVKPAFLKHGYWMKPGFRDPTRGLDADEDLDKFFNRNRFLDYDALYGNARDGSIMTPIRRRKLTPETDPEMFALNADGSRSSEIPCMSNPGVRRVLVEDACAYFGEHPEANFVGYAPPDGLPVCYCKDCLRANGGQRMYSQATADEIPCISGAYYALLRDVAEEVGRKFPGKVVSASIYAGRILPPPDFYRMPSNVVGFLALIEYTLMHPVDDPSNWQSAQIRSLVRSWSSRIDGLCYRPYYPSFLVNLALPMPLWRNTVRDVKWMQANGVRGFVWEGWPSFSTGGIDYYLRSRLLWDPSADGEAIMDEFFGTFYGPASGPVKAFYLALGDAVTKAPFNSHEAEPLREVYTRPLVDSLLPLVGQAEAAVRGKGEDLERRVRMVRLQADHLAAFAEMRDDAERVYDYRRAAQLADRMTALEDEMLGICPSFVFTRHRKFDADRLAKDPLNGNFSSVGWAGQYRRLAALTDGTAGRLVRTLPEDWKLNLDSIQEGVSAQWFAPETDISGWRDIKIGHPLETQGVATDARRVLPYLGDAWYAVDFELGDNVPGGTSLYAGGINNEAWVWINGRLVRHQPQHAWWDRPNYSWTAGIPADVLKRGKNRMTVRVRCVDRHGFGGIFRGMFIYEPVER